MLTIHSSSKLLIASGDHLQRAQFVNRNLHACLISQLLPKQTNSERISREAFSGIWEVSLLLQQKNMVYAGFLETLGFAEIIDE